MSERRASLERLARVMAHESKCSFIAVPYCSISYSDFDLLRKLQYQ
jgi:hypothetical protein